MSIYFNQTNLSPGTAIATGGGSLPINPVFASVQFTPALSGNPTDSDTLGQGFDPYSGNNMVSVVQKSSENLGPLLVGDSVQVQQGGNGPSTALYRMLYDCDGITWEQANTGTSFGFMAVDPAKQTFGLSNIATVNGNPPVNVAGNSTATMAFGTENLGVAGTATITIPFSYKDTSYSVVVTQVSGQPTIAPWAKINGVNTFDLAGDSNADVSWITMGLV